MAKYIPVSQSSLENLTWDMDRQKYMAEMSTVPLGGSEIIPAILHVPLVFLEGKNGFLPHAILGIGDSGNLYLRDFTDWMPLSFTAFPFAFLEGDEGKSFFCVHEGAVHQKKEPGDALFYQEDGKLTPEVQARLDAAREYTAGMGISAAFCALLSELDLLRPFPVSLRLGEKERTLEGMYAVHEERLRELSEQDFLRLRTEGMLPLLYAQLFSARHFTSFSRRMSHKPATEAAPGGDMFRFAEIFR